MGQFENVYIKFSQKLPMADHEADKRKVYTHEFVVQPHEIDAMGHVNNVIYLKWAQDAAEAHWESKGNQELKSKYKWVVLRHEIDYLSPAFSGQTILARTWVESYAGAKSDRIVELVNVETQKLLARSKTTWCLLDSQSLRPRRVEQELINIFAPE
jgi:acyl-CoA thioester hydrolase